MPYLYVIDLVYFIKTDEFLPRYTSFGMLHYLSDNVQNASTNIRQ